MTWFQRGMNNTLAQLMTSVSLTLVLNGCVTNYVDRAPLSPSVPWHETTSTGAVSRPDFTLPPISSLSKDPAQPQIDTTHAYSLAELINVAQLNNPDTRIAWQQARQAALAVGLTESVFLPIITASVVGGYQHTRTPLPYTLGQRNTLQTDSHEVVPALVLQWLLFDFGQRQAIMSAAENVSFAANMSFNVVHQKIIFDVMRTYYQYGAAQSRSINAAEMLANSQKILDAVVARRNQGIATIVELAQTRQLVAQSELNLVLASNGKREALQVLSGALGIPADTHINVDFPAYNMALKSISPPSRTMIEQALGRRSDILASYALALAAKQDIDAAQAAYLPKIYIAGALASGRGQFDIQGLPAIGQQTSASNILIGVTVPLYDGGMRAIRVQEAKSRANLADETFKKNHDAAAREIVVASDALQSAIAANKASVNLVSTAMVTYDAAYEAYRHGVGTVTVANEAANNLLIARQAETDARTAMLIAAANLAFVMGDITQAVSTEEAR